MTKLETAAVVTRDSHLETAAVVTCDPHLECVAVEDVRIHAIDFRLAHQSAQP